MHVIDAALRPYGCKASPPEYREQHLEEVLKIRLSSFSDSFQITNSQNFTKQLQPDTLEKCWSSKC